jgi:hypothetical protein
MKCENKYIEATSYGKKILQRVVHFGEKRFIYNMVHTCNDEQRTKNLLFLCQQQLCRHQSTWENGQQKS